MEILAKICDGFQVLTILRKTPSKMLGSILNEPLAFALNIWLLLYFDHHALPYTTALYVTFFLKNADEIFRLKISFGVFKIRF